MQLSLSQKAAGKWRGILVALGFDVSMLDGKHRPCPACGGSDRWRFDDRGGKGTFFCSHCGAGDGIELVMRTKDWDFKTAAVEIERAAGFVKPEALKAGKTDDEKAEALRRLWNESVPVTPGDEVSRYFASRGLTSPQTKALRFHPGLYYREGEVTGRYPAMLALVSAPDGSGASLHRTYLLDGRKAPVAKARKMMPGLPISGCAIRLFPVAPCLGIAEGLETAVGAANRFRLPVWSVVSAQGMEAWVCPDEVEEVVIFGDNDESFTGQRAAFTLAYKLKELGKKVRIEIPGLSIDDQMIGKDWADVA